MTSSEFNHTPTHVSRSEIGGSSDLERAVRAIRTSLGKRRMAALIVNSYEQVRLVVEQIHAVNPELGRRTRGVLREIPSDRTRVRYVLRGQVEGLGPDPEVDVLVFPLAALGRGMNVVFTAEDEDKGRAAIGSVFFLTRPHPAAGDLGLMLSLLAQETEHLDAEDLSALDLAEVQQVFDQRRYAVFRKITRLLARPMSASQLDAVTRRAFAANLLVAVLQTIGRAIRNRMPVEVYFVDAAWAPNSAMGRPETDRSSVLVTMRDVLTSALSAEDQDQRDIHWALYGVFAEAFAEIEGLIPPAEGGGAEEEDFSPSPAGLEDAMDGWEPGDSEAVDVSMAREEQEEEVEW